MTITLTSKNFLNHSARTPAFEALLSKCLREKAGLCLRIKGENVQISLTPLLEKSVRMRVEGKGNFALIKGLSNSVGAALLMPFLIDINRIVLPHYHIVALIPHQRTVADFFARNLFFAASKRGCIRFEHSAELDNPMQTKNAVDFRKRYLWVCKAVLNESAFNADDAISKLLMNAYFQIFEFENSILESGVALLRDAMAQKYSSLTAAPVNEEFFAIRNEILERLP